MTAVLRRLAPAKVNLFLHVGPVADDGYHPVSSLMVFADVGDEVRLSPAQDMGFCLEGPFADALGPDGDNLVLAARDRLLAGLPPASGAAPFRLTLDKRLPIAAGLGGGSADAAATMRLVADHLAARGLPGPDADMLDALARGLGADVAACLESRPVLATGRGDRLAPAPPMPPLDAVLVNPRAPCPTGGVYRAYDAGGAVAAADTPKLPDRLETVRDVIDHLRPTRNDLQAPAIALQPLIGEVLAALSERPETLLSRMSGSGATCFALCADTGSAQRLAADLAQAHPAWWVSPCRLVV
jgi:4-diphosphocytidyl-2-C-methyl-D-erythritol kinase